MQEWLRQDPRVGQAVLVQCRVFMKTMFISGWPSETCTKPSVDERVHQMPVGDQSTPSEHWSGVAHS